MANEFKIKNGLIVNDGGAYITGSTYITGALFVTGSINSTIAGFTGSLFGTASYSTTAISASILITGSISAQVTTDPTQLFIVKSGTTQYLNISSSGNSELYSNLFIVKNFTTKQAVLTVSESIVTVATQSSIPTGTAPNGGIWFTSASMYIGLD